MLQTLRLVRRDNDGDLNDAFVRADRQRNEISGS